MIFATTWLRGLALCFFVIACIKSSQSIAVSGTPTRGPCKLKACCLEPYIDCWMEADSFSFASIQNDSVTPKRAFHHFGLGVLELS